MPEAVAAYRRLWSGVSPFHEPNLYSGHYSLLRDPAALAVWSPLSLLSSPLALTRWYFALIEPIAILNLTLAATAFGWLLVYLRNHPTVEGMKAPLGDFSTLSDRRIVWIALSYAFSAWALIVGTSWHMFLANEAALPLVLLALVHQRRGAGITLGTAAIAYGMLAGHLDPALWTFLLGSLFVCGFCFVTRSAEPLRRWATSAALAVLVLSPLLWPAFTSFSASGRSLPLSIQGASALNVPWLVLPISYFLGSLSLASGQVFRLGYLSAGHSYAIGACLAAGGLWHGIAGRRHTAFEKLLLLLAGLTVVCIIRPYALGWILHQLPLLRSLRWPFREILFLHLWTHLYIASRPVSIPVRWRHLTAGASALAWAASLLTFGAPTLNLMPLDRDLLFSGEAARFWAARRAEAPPGTVWVPCAPLDWARHRQTQVPFTLLGAYDYPALFGAPSVSGYAIPGLTPNWTHFSGVYSPRDRDALLSRDARARSVSLASLTPLRLELEWRGGRKELPDLARLP